MNTLSEIISTNESLKRRLRRNAAMARYAAAVQLLEGGEQSARLTVDNLSLLGLSLTLDRFAVAVLPAGDAPTGEVTEWLGDGAQTYLCTLDNRRAAILNYADDATLASMLPELVRTGEVICVSSTPCASVSQLHALYLEACAAESALPLRPEGAVFAYASVDKIKKELTLPQTLEKSVERALRDGDARQACEIVEAWIAEQDPSRLSLEAARRALSLLKLNLLQAMGAAAHEPIVELPKGADPLIELEAFFARAVQLERPQTGRQRSEQAVALEKYLSEHLCSPQLSLTMVAEAFSVQPSYLSRSFKEHFSTNFLDYVNRSRIDLAQELLATGEFTVQEVAERVGFSSDATFRRLYKKYKGVTPKADARKNG